MPDIKVLTRGETSGSKEEFNLQPTLDGKMEVTGFPTDADGRTYFCTLTYNETTRTVTITPTGATFDIFVGGVKHTFTGAQSIVHGAQQGVHFVYFDTTGTLVTSQVPWDILSHVPTCYVFRDAISGLSIAWEERHHANRDLYWHANQHYNEGTKARSGFAISGYVLNSSVDANIAFAIASGIVDDEDIAVTTEALPDAGPYTIMRRSGAAGDWVIDRTPVLPFLISGSDAAYNQWTGATWQMTASANNRFLNYYVLATSALPSTAITPASSNQYILIPGQATFNTLALAQAELISAIQWGDIPFQEVAPLYKITLQRSNGYATTGRCRLAAVARITGTYVQVTQATNPQHGALLGLTNDDHPQYPILSSGVVAPATTPDRVGALYVDTAAPALYVGKGIASSADWFNTTGGGSGRPAIVTTVSVSGDWTMGASTEFVRVIAKGGAGGGGSGGACGAGGTATGGAGGGGGAIVDITLTRAEVIAAYATGVVPCVIGAGGIGGTGVASGIGATGLSAGDTTFGTLVTAWRGGSGGNGAAAPTVSVGGGGGSNGARGNTASTSTSRGAGAGGSGASPAFNTCPSGAGGGGGCSVAVVAFAGAASATAGVGGGAGGGVTSVPSTTAGAAGAPRLLDSAGGAGGLAGVGAADGSAGTGGAAPLYALMAGQGGGGGGGSNGGKGGNGGNGGIASGGGGGGGIKTTSGKVSGNGGNGGPGEIIVMEF